MSSEELRQILKIGPKTALTSIEICNAITKFWHENPEEYRRVMEERDLAELREKSKFLGTFFRSLREES